MRLSPSRGEVGNVAGGDVRPDDGDFGGEAEVVVLRTLMKTPRRLMMTQPRHLPGASGAGYSALVSGLQ